MRSGSERMHTWRKTPSTGRNFQTLIIWITVSQRQFVMVQFLSINFFSLISSIFVGFFKSSRFFVLPCTILKKSVTTTFDAILLCSTTFKCSVDCQSLILNLICAYHSGMFQVKILTSSLWGLGDISQVMHTL